jgi:hypothetical protein
MPTRSTPITTYYSARYGMRQSVSVITPPPVLPPPYVPPVEGALPQRFDHAKLLARRRVPHTGRKSP